MNIKDDKERQGTANTANSQRLGLGRNSWELAQVLSFFTLQFLSSSIWNLCEILICKMVENSCSIWSLKGTPRVLLIKHPPRTLNPSKNPGVLAKHENTDLGNPLKAFFHSTPGGVSCKIYLHDKKFLKAAHFKWQPKFTHLLQPVTSPGSLSQYHRTGTQNRSVSIPSRQCSNKNLLLVFSFYELILKLLTFDDCSLPTPLINQNMGFNFKFPAPQSAQIGGLCFLNNKTKSHFICR